MGLKLSSRLYRAGSEGDGSLSRFETCDWERVNMRDRCRCGRG